MSTREKSLVEGLPVSNKRGRCRLGTLATMAALALVGCGAQSAASDAAEDLVGEGEIRETQAAVLNGYSIQSDDYSGVVRLFTVNSKFSEIRQFCSGVLLRNNVVLTAKHCLNFTPQALAYGWPDVHNDTSLIVVATDQLGFAALGKGAPFHAPGGRDVAAFRLDRNLPVRSQGSIMTSGYARALRSLTSGQMIVTMGYGETTAGGVPSTVCNYVSVTNGARTKGCPQDPLVLNFGFGSAAIDGTHVLTVDWKNTSGDSGGPVFALGSNTSSDMADMRLVGINSSANYCVVNTGPCGADGERVDDLPSWLASIPY